MTEAIMLALWVITTLFFICREIKQKRDRESYERWLSDVRDCIHSIEREFHRKCKEIVEEDLSQKRFAYSYYGKIRALEEKCKAELIKKIVALKRVNVTTLPEHIVREYERNISDIADTFCNFGNFMSER